MSVQENRPVLILDCHRGIYFGYLVEELDGGKTVILENARHCFYFVKPAKEHEGVYGLATIGPQKGSRVGPRVDMKVMDVTKIVTCTSVAVVAWEAARWG
tara:strand:- start:21 stop:320 length:300 start_codon:yes stop_codon:yes gene_type:complete